MTSVNVVASAVFVVLFGFITWLGFAAARWRRGDLEHLHEWGLGGRRFGTLVTWFLIGGDLYTAYTFIAVPALMFGAGAIGFFAVPYTIIVYPILFVVFPRLWQVAHRHGFVTVADFIRGRFGNRWLALAVTLTGIIATMPYIALQLVGLQAVIAALGLTGEGIVGELPLIIGFLILAAFTYSSGLRAPAAIAIVKDTLIFITVFAVIVVVPARLGGYGAVFGAVAPAKLLLAVPPPGSTGSYSVYATQALGSAMALLLYPHSVTAILSASSGHAVRRNAAMLPAYSLVLGLLALLGFMAIAAGLDKLPEYAGGFKQFKANFAVPALILQFFPSWFAGVAFAAIGIGALVPAAIMSIAAANLYTRNIYKEFLRPDCSHADESRMAKWVSLVVKAGALLFILLIDPQYAIYMQLLGGIWIIQTLPAVMFGLFTRWFNSWALLAGWALGMTVGTTVVASAGFKPTWALAIGGYSIPGYTALYTLLLNLAVAAVLTLLLKALGKQDRDATVPSDYLPAQDAPAA
jgi:SSS family solute:Na+ symporter